MVEEEMKNIESEILYKKTSTILSARSGNLTKEQMSSLDQMTSKLNENLENMIGGRELEDFKNNETAIEKMAEIVKDDLITYNSFVVSMFNLTEKDVEMTKDDFCKAVAEICAKTWIYPSEVKTTTNGTEMLKILHKDHKDLIDAEEEMKNIESLYEKTSTILSARSGNLTKEQRSSLDQMISKLNENIENVVGGRDLTDFKNNETAVEKMAEVVKDDLINYNSFVVSMFNLTEKEVEMTKDDFCKAVAEICAKTWIYPFEVKTTSGPEMLKILQKDHKDHKDLINGAMNHTETTKNSNILIIIEGQKWLDNMESFSSAMKPDWTLTHWIIIVVSLSTTFKDWIC